MARVREKVTEVEVTEEPKGPTGPEIGVDIGIIVGTTLCLLTAIVCVLLALKSHYGAGPLA